jgi:hypothetical protein
VKANNHPFCFFLGNLGKIEGVELNTPVYRIGSLLKLLRHLEVVATGEGLVVEDKGILRVVEIDIIARKKEGQPDQE